MSQNQSQVLIKIDRSPAAGVGRFAPETALMAAKPDLRIVLCSPRGFCAGVVRAIDTVERALTIYGAPVYVRHEIVHNKYVVDSLKKKGAIFVEELAEIPDNTNAPVVFSAHGVPKSVPAEAKVRNFFSLDATCPLVTKVHREAAIHLQARPRNPPDRAFASPGSGRHARAIAGRCGDADRDRGRCAHHRAKGPE